MWSSGASPVVLVVKNPPANAGDRGPQFYPWVGKRATETHSNILAWRICQTEETSPQVHKESDTTELP